MNTLGTTSMSMNALLAGFQRALRALVPIADDLGVRWREPENYSDWDAIANGAFEGFVLSAVRSSLGWTECLPLVDYDKRIADYGQYSYVAITLQGQHLPLVCIETAVDPFDTCLVADLGTELKVRGHLRVPFSECRFAAVGQLSAGGTTVIDSAAW
ncbi:MAG: hypothetical protein WAQ05_16325 [Rubrivivax sp.]